MLRATNKKYFWDLTYISIFQGPICTTSTNHCQLDHINQKLILAFWIYLVLALFTLDWYQHLSFWIGISAFFELVSVSVRPFMYRLGPLKTCGIGCDL
ncbi:hypothetical protein RhiirA5_418958 [Rhizophagus irregularis]|uniref:Uncharacterized protein n=1 Tax=Rhizophagus irregularis TaxID=588596 RepID=A0A2N0PJA0_9GLOM|nr:hypothetical protein RhiirA5_418958 [Rhizophagus irregularis]